MLNRPDSASLSRDTYVMVRARRFSRVFACVFVVGLALVVGPKAGAAPTAALADSGIFTPPLPLAVITDFRPAATKYGAGHRGVDLAATAGESVVAAADGVVVYAGKLADRGVVSIEHRGGLRTTYEPLLAAVAAGDQVRRGDPIGVIEAGHPPCAPAICLHFGARLPDHVYLDPLALFGPWTVHLKPW